MATIYIWFWFSDGIVFPISVSQEILPTLCTMVLRLFFFFPKAPVKHILIFQSRKMLLETGKCTSRPHLLLWEEVMWNRQILMLLAQLFYLRLLQSQLKCHTVEGRKARFIIGKCLNYEKTNTGLVGGKATNITSEVNSVLQKLHDKAGQSLTPPSVFWSDLRCSKFFASFQEKRRFL